MSLEILGKVIYLYGSYFLKFNKSEGPGWVLSERVQFNRTLHDDGNVPCACRLIQLPREHLRCGWCGRRTQSLIEFYVIKLKLSHVASVSVLDGAAVRKIKMEVKADVLGLGSTVSLVSCADPLLCYKHALRPC